MVNTNGDTHSFVKKVQETQKKDQKNRQHQGNGHPEQKLPNKQH